MTIVCRKIGCGSVGLLILVSAVWTTSCFADEPLKKSDARDREKEAAKWITPAAEKATRSGLVWLAEKQHDDGSLGNGPNRGNVAVSGFAGMAFMMSGSTPGRGEHGKKIDLCIDYILSRSQPSGFINGPDSAQHGPMYGHGFATMFLAECYGMTPRKEMKDVLNRAVKLIVNCQNNEGGWRYFPQKMDADLSVTVCQIMALRAARNAGIVVPRETIDRAVAYVKKSQNPDGGFMYMLQGGPSEFPRSAAGITAMYSAGLFGTAEIDRGLDYVMQFIPSEKEQEQRRGGYYFYGHYYAVQAMWQDGGKRFSRWYPAVRDELIALQADDGSWQASEGNECGTAFACMILQIPNNFLPIFQR